MSYGVPDPRAEEAPDAQSGNTENSTTENKGDDVTNGQPDPNRNKPSQAEGSDEEEDTVSPKDPAGNKPSQAEGDEETPAP
ncbi:hypothetical protein SAMN04489806_1251 [Paramicrobacterium humi]|uniref:Uncharacterized protein n=1 Tax=Paramicrobacterium humi TaxID=640635 RepID=A0A1H4KQ24_9MICO|nr:hypothetical protein [Microbacterium humi]SEB60326.1 hypothetical protein SAMN04489806_1251 [Microbacterium humi]